MIHPLSKRFVTVAICTALATGLGGYTWGSSRSSSAPSAVLTEPDPQKGKGNAPEDATRIRQNLIAGYQYSPDINVDWELLDQTNRVLKQLPEGEVRALYQQIDPKFSLTLTPLRERILDELLVRNPQAALTLVPAPEIKEAIYKWGKIDAVAAIAWTKSNSDPASRQDLLKGLLQDQTANNFPFVETQIRGLTGVDRTAVLRWLVSSQSGITAHHKRFLDLATASEVSPNLEYIQKGLIGVIALEDYKEAYQVLDTFVMAPAAKMECEAELVKMSSDHGAAVQAWNARHPTESKVPEGVTKGLWSAINQPEKATEGLLEWLNGLPAGAQRDSFYQTTALVLARNHRFELSVLYLAAIDDNALRWSNLQDIHAMWQAADPKCAAAWRATLPPADLEKVGE